MIAINHPKLHRDGPIGRILRNHAPSLDYDEDGCIIAVDEQLACTLIDCGLGEITQWAHGPLPDAISLIQPINPDQLQLILEKEYGREDIL